MRTQHFADTFTGSAAPLVRRRAAAICAAILSLSMLAACRKKSTAAMPAPPRPAVVTPQAPAPPSLPVSEPQTRVTLPPPQEIPAGAAPHFPGPIEAEAARDAAAAAAARAETPSPSRPTQRPTNGNEVPAATAPPPTPQLGQMLSAAQRRQYNEQTDRSLTEARRNLNVATRRSLSAAQMAVVRRIQGYIDQASDARRQDIRMASNLADRARLLAEDLVRNLP